MSDQEYDNNFMSITVFYFWHFALELTNNYIDKNECDQDEIGNEPENGNYWIPTITMVFRTIGLLNLHEV